MQTANGVLEAAKWFLGTVVNGEAKFEPHHVGRSFDRRQARPQRGLTNDCCVIHHDSTRMLPARPRPRSTPHAEGRPLFCALFCAGAASFALNAARGTLTIAEQAATAVLRGTQWLTRETALGALNAAQAVANAVLTGIGEPSQDGPDGFANTPPVGSRCILRSCTSCLLQPTITFWASCHQPQSPPCCRAAVLQSGPR